mgnify:CR=1 FL=1
MFSTFERIKDLAKKRGISLQNVATDLGFSVNYMYSLKTKKTPSAEHIAKIADYFNVSTDYLLGRTDNPRIATKDDTAGIDFKEIAKSSMSYDGKPLNDEDIDLIASILETRMKNRDKE